MVHWLAACVLVAWHMAVSGASSGVGVALPHPGVEGGVSTVLITVLTYLRLTLFPILLNADRPFPSPPAADAMAVIAGAVILFLTARSLGERRPAGFWVFWAAVFFLPVSNLFFVSARPIAEQRLYVPSVAFCVLAGLGTDAALRRTRRRGGARPALALALLVVWIAVSVPMVIRRSAAWQDNYSFWSVTLRRSPRSRWAAQELGIAYAKRKDWPRATRLLRRARLLSPRSPLPPYNLGGALFQQGKLAEAEACLRDALALAPHSAATYFGLGLLFEKLRRYEDAVRMLSRSIQLDPRDPMAYLCLARVQTELGRVPEAEGNRQRAIALDPGLASGGW